MRAQAREDGDFSEEQIDEAFDAFDRAHPKGNLTGSARQKCRERFRQAVAEGADPDWIVRSARLYRAETEHREPRYVSAAVKWLEDRRWRDYPPPSGVAEGLQRQADAQAAEWIREGKGFLVQTLPATRARALIEQGLVTEDQCRAVGVYL